MEGTGESYWFFQNAFGRDSYNGAGLRMKTVNNDRASLPQRQLERRDDELLQRRDLR